MGRKQSVREASGNRRTSTRAGRKATGRSRRTGPARDSARSDGIVDAPTPRVIASATEPPADNAASKQMHIVLLADDKDHGPAGNGLHDYPLWQKRWALLLGGKEASEEKQLNPVGTPSEEDTESVRGAPDVHVTTAWDWPSDDQFQTADVIVAYCYLDWTEDRLAQVRQYLEDGGGLVLIHSATWTKPKPSPDVGRVIGIGGFQLFRHGPARLEIAAPEHPICSGLPDTIVLDDDETYWPPTPMIDSVMVLATSIEEEGGAGGPPPKTAQPMFWCYEPGRGRVFGCVPGHRIKTFDDPMFRTLLLRGIAWAAGESPCRLDSLAKAKTDPLR